MYHKGNNNANLDDTPTSSSLYNALPHIDSMKSAATEHAAARRTLLKIIARHGLQHHFSIHLVHKHFEIPEGRIMVYETVTGPNHPAFILCSPRAPEKCENLRGLYFRARPGGTMAAYEYTTELGEDLSSYTDFVSEFSTTVTGLGVQDVFALTAKKPESARFTEFEMPDLNSTVLVTNANWLPSSSVPPTSTDWITNCGPEGGIITLTDCTKTTSGSHYNFTCSRTRSGAHYQQKGVWVDDGKGGMEPQFFLNGVPVPRDSEPFAIISRASQMVTA